MLIFLYVEELLHTVIFCDPTFLSKRHIFQKGICRWLKKTSTTVLADITFLLFDPNISKKMLKAANTIAGKSFSPCRSFLVCSTSTFLKGML